MRKARRLCRLPLQKTAAFVYVVKTAYTQISENSYLLLASATKSSCFRKLAVNSNNKSGIINFCIYSGRMKNL
jgi:hypothetical protein